MCKVSEGREGGANWRILLNISSAAMVKSGFILLRLWSSGELERAVIIHEIPRNTRSLLARRRLGITASKEVLWASSSLDRTLHRLSLAILLLLLLLLLLLIIS